MSINNWPTTERPREKLLLQGPQALSNAELLAILFRTGIRGRSALDMGIDLLTRFNGLAGLFSTAHAQLQNTPGLGQAKIASLLAVQELSRRAALESIRQQDALTSPAATRDYLCQRLSHEHRELFWGLFLNSQHQVVASEALSHGTIDSASVYPREVVKACLQHNAAAIIFAHNHPSGSLLVSEADKAITATLQKALNTVDIRVLDHFIVGGNRAVSMAEMGLL